MNSNGGLVLTYNFYFISVSLAAQMSVQAWAVHSVLDRLHSCFSTVYACYLPQTLCI